MARLFSDVKLSDFGLARETSPENDASVRVAGTPPYMSPEQIQTPGLLSLHTDIYSLGVVLYEILTGSRPFRGNDVALRRQIIHDQPTPLRQLNPQIPLDLETICLRALHKEPSRRFDSANDFADDLQRWLDGRPIVSRPIGRVEKAYMWARRSPELASLCLLMFVTAVLSLGAAIWISRLRTSEAQARLAADESASEATKHRNISLETMQMMVTDLGERIGTHDALISLYPKVTEQLEEINDGKAATPESQYALAISNLRTAQIYSAFNMVIQSPKASEKIQKHFERSESLLRNLVGDHRLDLIKVYDGLGSDSLRVGDYVAAQASFQSALKIGEELLQKFPDDTTIARNIAVALESLGKIMDSRDPQPLKFIARVNLGFCKILRKEMKLVEAKNSAAEAINIRRKIVTLSPIAFNITSLVVALKEVADIEQQLEQFEPALMNLDEAIARLEELKKAQELLPQYEEWIPELVGQREDILRGG